MVTRIKKEDNARKLYAKKQRGNKNIDEQHKSKYDVKLRVKVACYQVIPDIKKSEILNPNIVVI